MKRIVYLAVTVALVMPAFAADKRDPLLCWFSVNWNFPVAV